MSNFLRFTRIIINTNYITKINILPKKYEISLLKDSVNGFFILVKKKSRFSSGLYFIFVSNLLFNI